MKNINWPNHIIELIIIVLGILVALGINNWNEDRKDKIVEYQYYRDLLVDLKQDTAVLAKRLALSDKRIRDIQIVFDAINIKNYPEAKLRTLIDTTNYNLFAFFPQSSTLDDIISSGNTGLLEADVKSSLFELRGFQRLRRRYEEGNNEQTIWMINQYLSVVDSSYPRFKNNQYGQTAQWHKNYNSPKFLKYTNMLSMRMATAEKHKGYYKELRKKTLEVISILKGKI